MFIQSLKGDFPILRFSLVSLDCAGAERWTAWKARALKQLITQTGASNFHEVDWMQIKEPVFLFSKQWRQMTPIKQTKVC